MERPADEWHRLQPVDREPSYTRSSSIAIPWPTPTHIDAIAYLALPRLN